MTISKKASEINDRDQVKAVGDLIEHCTTVEELRQAIGLAGITFPQLYGSDIEGALSKDVKPLLPDDGKDIAWPFLTHQFQA
jgi:hypothetical protein